MQNKTLQLPALYRAISLKRKADIDAEARIISCVAASQQPVPRWFGNEILLCTPDACDLSRLLNGAPLLSDHDRTRQIGVVASAKLEGGRLLATVRLSKNESGEKEFQDILDGIRSKISIGYFVEEMEEQPGGNPDEPTMIATRWQPFEISLVSVEADTMTGIGRGADTREIHISQSTQVRDLRMSPLGKTNSHQLIKTTMSTTNAQHRALPNGGSGNPNENNDAPDTLREARETESARVVTLVEMGNRYGCADEARRAADDGTLVPKFWRWIQENRGSSFSGLRAGTSTPTQNRSLGEIVTSHESFRAYLQNGGRAGFALSIQDAPSIREAYVRALTETGSSVSIQSQSPMLNAGANLDLMVADLIPFNMGVTGNNVPYMRQGLTTGGADAVAEGAAKPAIGFVLEQINGAFEVIAGLVSGISNQIIEDVPNFRFWLNNELSFEVLRSEEDQILSGVGGSPNLQGLLNTPGIQTHAKAADIAADAIFKGITKIRVNGLRAATGIVLHPNDWERIRLAKDDNAQYYGSGPLATVPIVGGVSLQVPSLWNLPVAQSVYTPEGTALVGAFASCARIHRRTGIRIELFPSGDDFTKNLQTARAEERIALECNRPAAFCTVTGLNT